LTVIDVVYTHLVFCSNLDTGGFLRRHGILPAAEARGSSTGAFYRPMRLQKTVASRRMLSWVLG
jgi:hypothetical protein